MHSVVLLAALTGVGADEKSQSPVWVTDYAAARKQGEAEKKPLVLFIASGKAGWEKVGQNGLSEDAKRVLAAQYVCVYINAATDEGKDMAKALEMTEGLGIVISDGTGKLQAFRHEGDLANSDLTRYLQRFADPDRVVRSTESSPGNHSGASSAFSPGYCPSCSGGRRIR
jgi:hypothetical protein